MAKLKSKRRYSRNKNRKKSTKRRTRKRTKKQRGSGGKSSKQTPQLDDFGLIARSMGVDVEARDVVGELYNVVDNPGEKEGVQVEFTTLRGRFNQIRKNQLNKLYYLIPDYYATTDTYKDANGGLDI